MTECVGNKCIFGLLPDDVIPTGGSAGQQYFVLGDIFLEQFFSIFDYDNKRVGFVSKGSSETSFDYEVLTIGLGIGLVAICIIGIAIRCWCLHYRSSMGMKKQGGQKYDKKQKR